MRLILKFIIIIYYISYIQYLYFEIYIFEIILFTKHSNSEDFYNILIIYNIVIFSNNVDWDTQKANRALATIRSLDISLFFISNIWKMSNG